MTNRKFTPPTDLPAEYVTEDGRKATIVACRDRCIKSYIGYIDGVTSWVMWYWDGTHTCQQYTLKDLPQHKLNIPWEHIKDKYQYAAMDESGDVWVYEKEPTQLGHDCIWVSTGEELELDRYKAMKLNPSDVHWSYSLTKRPEKS